jgi:arginase
MENIKFIINRSEITAGTRGSSLGPDAIKVVAWKKENFLFGKYPVEEIDNANHYLNKPVVHQYAKRIEGLIFIFDQISQKVKNTISEDKFPIILAGDHGSAGGTIAGIKAAYPNKRIGVIWVDAHGDLHTPYTTPSGNMHGMPLSTVLNDDNLQVKRNDIPEETKVLWEKLKNIGYSGAKVNPEDLIFVGVRDVEAEEIALMERLNIRNFTVEEIQQKGALIIASQINQLLSNCDLIYVSFDVDSMDPEETSHGTGTPVSNGLTVSETKILLKELVKNPKLACFEIVEVNPCLDEKKNKMAEVAFDVLQEVVTILEDK